MLWYNTVTTPPPRREEVFRFLGGILRIFYKKIYYIATKQAQCCEIIDSLFRANLDYIYRPIGYLLFALKSNVKCWGPPLFYLPGQVPRLFSASSAQKNQNLLCYGMYLTPKHLLCYWLTFIGKHLLCYASVFNQNICYVMVSKNTLRTCYVIGLFYNQTSAMLWQYLKTI